MRGKLKLFILIALKDSSKSGYDLIKFIENKTGHKPSPGSIYPVLKSLVKKKLLKVTIKGRKKIYSLTKAGREKVKSIHKIREAIIKQHLEGMKLLQSFGVSVLTKREHLRFLKEFPFKVLNPEMIQFLEALFYALPKLKENPKLVKLIKTEFAKLTRIIKKQ